MNPIEPSSTYHCQGNFRSENKVRRAYLHPAYTYIIVSVRSGIDILKRNASSSCQLE